MEKGTLFIVATPIGNLGDITLRALETLRSVDLVLCEDTRVTRKLLNHFEIPVPTESYHEHSDEEKIRKIIALLEEGKNIALVTDAGTPGISDPGSWLVRRITDNPNQITDNRKQITSNTNSEQNYEEQIHIIPVPGASAAVAALSICGFPADKFLFLGFPPHKKGRSSFFLKVAESENTVVFYESSHRITKCISELANILSPERNLCICRELTKKFESVYRGTIAEISKQKIPEKGEFVIVISAK